jgi:Helix-turn-helix domain
MTLRPDYEQIVSPRRPVQLVMTPRQGQEALQIGPTKLWELIKEGELDSFLDGNRRRITTASILDYIARRLAASPSRKAMPTRHGQRRAPD